MASLKEILKNTIGSSADLDLYRRISRDIKKVREQGERPKEDPVEVDTYICDLCMKKVQASDIVQCGFCGRWVCRDQCWSSEEHMCESCLGIVRIHRESIRNINEAMKLVAEGDDK